MPQREAPTMQRGGRGLRRRTQREAPTRRSAWLEADAARDEEIGWHAFAKSGVGAAGGGDSGALHCGFDGCAGAAFKPPADANWPESDCSVLDGCIGAELKPAVDANWPESDCSVLDGCIGAALKPAVDADRLESDCEVGGGGALLCRLGSYAFARRRRSLSEEPVDAFDWLDGVEVSCLGGVEVSSLSSSRSAPNLSALMDFPLSTVGEDDESEESRAAHSALWRASTVGKNDEPVPLDAPPAAGEIPVAWLSLARSKRRGGRRSGDTGRRRSGDTRRGSRSSFEMFEGEDNVNDAQPHDNFESCASGEDNDALPHDSFEGRASGQRLDSVSNFGDKVTVAAAALPWRKKVVVPPPQPSPVLRVVG